GKYKQLTSWIENQRIAKKKNLLLPDREQQLNELGFIWSFKDIKQDYWLEKYKQLKAFKEINGHCFVPVNYPENKSLGIWVATQRNLEAKGQLEKNKKKKLNQLGFIWRSNTQQELGARYDAQWNLNFERLKIYQQVYNTCQVSLKINPALQRWTRWQRILFYQGKLSKERMEKLNEIRFPWNIQEGYWMKMYEALVDFRNQFGHTQVPYQWAANPQLAAWAYRMRLNKSDLTASKIELLNMIGFDWRLNRKTIVSWEGMYERLIQFKQQYGHTRVPITWKQDPKLGKWVSRMRHEKGKLFPERIALLNKLEFDWSGRSISKRPVNQGLPLQNSEQNK
ncbi:MAG: helicase associated domain-containing protein, partial [Bacteroidota bacterium]|nr:helicase associated domain-containing protein [Bacteroidota bacterium]